jgi:hypothetical protein
MAYQNRVVCFFDILGFGNVVKEKKLGADEIQHIFSEINAIVCGRSGLVSRP